MDSVNRMFKTAHLLLNMQEASHLNIATCQVYTCYFNMLEIKNMTMNVSRLHYSFASRQLTNVSSNSVHYLD